MRTALSVILVIAAQAAMSAEPADRKACEKVKRDIARLESRMRAGYTAKQGRRLEERLRELRVRRYRVCR